MAQPLSQFGLAHCVPTCVELAHPHKPLQARQAHPCTPSPTVRDAPQLPAAPAALPLPPRRSEIAMRAMAAPCARSRPPLPPPPVTGPCAPAAARPRATAQQRVAALPHEGTPPTSSSGSSDSVCTATPLLDAVEERGRRESEVPFYVPGHKRGSSTPPALGRLMGDALRFDLTELAGEAVLREPASGRTSCAVARRLTHHRPPLVPATPPPHRQAWTC